METLSYNTFNPAIWEARRVQGIVAESGGRTHLIGHGGKGTDLEQVFSQMGRNLLDGGFKILTIVDFDGVMCNPIQTFIEFLKKPLLWPGGLNRLRDLGRVGIGRWRWLAKVTSVSDQVVLWTSRFLEPGDKEDSDFPFMSRSTKERIEKFGRGKLEIVTNKPLLGKDQALEKMLTGQRWGAINFVGSSHFDRVWLLELIKRNPDLAPTIVFFDTGHLLV